MSEACGNRNPVQVATGAHNPTGLPSGGKVRALVEEYCIRAKIHMVKVMQK
jgi:hypothetical protein